MGKPGVISKFVRRVFLGVLLTTAVLFLLSCAKKEIDPSDYRSYLGEYSYNSSITAMVYEDFEEEGFGIVYRQIMDYNGYVTHAPLPVLVYFYTPRHDDYAGTTAEVEQIAEDHHDRLLVVSVDVFQEEAIATHYRVEAVPEFVILNQGAVQTYFDSASRGSWSQDDLRQWVIDVLM
ncbi:MAG: hypothetical protein JW780_07825 [Clostridiales bacterium]|nr:hypothetical protein [Clostridiales bacterium]